MPSSSVASPTTAILASAAALGLVAAVAAVYARGNSSKQARSLKDIDDIDDDDNVDNNNKGEDYITEQEVVHVFTRLYTEMHDVFASLMQQIQAIQASGQMIPEKQLKLLIQAELERALLYKQHKICEEECNMDEDCLEEATMEFLKEENPQVIKAVERFQQLWETMTGESVMRASSNSSSSGSSSQKSGETTTPTPPTASPSRPSSSTSSSSSNKIVTAERMLEAAEVYFNALTQCMQGLVSEIRMAGKDLSHPSVAEELQMMFSSMASAMGEQALENKLGMTFMDFQKSIEMHASDPNVARILNMLRMRQQEQLMAMGVPMMMM